MILLHNIYSCFKSKSIFFYKMRQPIILSFVNIIIYIYYSLVHSARPADVCCSIRTGIKIRGRDGPNMCWILLRKTFMLLYKQTQTIIFLKLFLRASLFFIPDFVAISPWYPVYFISGPSLIIWAVWCRSSWPVLSTPGSCPRTPGKKHR